MPEPDTALITIKVPFAIRKRGGRKVILAPEGVPMPPLVPQIDSTLLKAIARAFANDPEILLMDEPFSALDALTRDEMSFELLRIWTSKPKTVMFITHSIPEAVLLSDRIIVMTPRPGSVREVLAVPLPRPRSLETLSDPAFHTLANRIRSQLFSRHAA